MKAPLAPVSWGELIDKITILEIKKAKILAEPANSNVRRELELLTDIAHSVLAKAQIEALRADLQDVNLALWEIEDRIREKEARQEFDKEFVTLARSVYQQNDRRAEIKRAINLALQSELVEEKSYKSYSAISGTDKA